MQSRSICRGGGGAVVLCALALLAPAARAASPPAVVEAFSTQVSVTSARLAAKINPDGSFTSYHLEYLSEAAYTANLAGGHDGFAGALRAPATGEINIGGGAVAVAVSQQLFSLAPETTYRYRLLAHNAFGAVQSAALSFTTRFSVGGSLLADGRGWELVSPPEKNGGQPASPGGPLGGAFQAAADGNAFTWSSQTSFGEGGQGSPPLSQYLSGRGASGWSTQNLSPPTLSGAYHGEGETSPYRLFSTDLARGVLLGGDRCRGEGDECAVANPPLPGTDAPAGYQDYYLREGGGYTAVLGQANAGFLTLDPRDFALSLAGAGADLRHVVLSSCAGLTVDALEVPAPEGCDPAAQNLYEWSGSGGLRLINLLPGETHGAPGATLAAPAGAISADGQRVYFSRGGNLYLREGSATKALPQSTGGSFQAASEDGSLAFFTAAGHLYRYSAATGGQSTDLTPAGGVAGVLGTSASGDTAYFQDAAGLKRWQAGTTTTVAAGAEAADASNWPPAAGTARVSAGGAQLLFVSSAPLTGYDNTDLDSGEADSEVFLYEDGSGLACLSCNPTEERPSGPSTVPGALPDSSAALYKPRALSADGGRAFFDSADSLVLADTDQAGDAYQWEAFGEGSCARAQGCVSLLSGGRAAGGAAFLDASADGDDAFFLTEGSLVGSDGGGADIYDARVAGGFAEAPAPIPCEGDACQPLPSAPADPTLTTLLGGPGNPPVRYPHSRKRCKRGYRLHKGHCVRKKTARRHPRHRKGSRR